MHVTIRRPTRRARLSLKGTLEDSCRFIISACPSRFFTPERAECSVPNCPWRRGRPPAGPGVGRKGEGWKGEVGEGMGRESWGKEGPGAGRKGEVRTGEGRKEEGRNGEGRKELGGQEGAGQEWAAGAARVPARRNAHRISYCVLAAARRNGEQTQAQVRGCAQERPTRTRSANRQHGRPFPPPCFPHSFPPPSFLPSPILSFPLPSPAWACRGAPPAPWRNISKTQATPANAILHSASWTCDCIHGCNRLKASKCLNTLPNV